MTSAYTGERTIDGPVVLDEKGEQLDPCASLASYSEGGVEWGYEGAAPSQLAFAIVYSRTRDTELAHKINSLMMREVIANLENEWSLPVVLLDEIIDDFKQRRNATLAS